MRVIVGFPLLWLGGYLVGFGMGRWYERRVEHCNGPAPCKWCNDEGVVHTHDGQIIGPCECSLIGRTSDAD